MIDYEALEDEYDALPQRAKVSKPSEPTGSLTDNRRIAEPNRNGAYKRTGEGRGR